jgi:flagellar hook protein FlgE
MMRSMFSGVSGLRAHQAKMDTIGNNIANVNTVGFKGNSVTFQEVFSQTIKGAGSPQGGRGGTNPQQIGLGVNVSALDINMGKGSTQRTDNPTDLMIDGSGFFVVTNDPNYQNKYYTRAGNFSTDRDGYLVTPGGFKVLGADFQPIQINKSVTKNATQTTSMDVRGNINFNDQATVANPIAYSTTANAYDSLGNVHAIGVQLGQLIPGAAGVVSNSYRAIKFDVPGTTGDVGNLAIRNAGDLDPTPIPYYAEFDSSGNFLRVVQLPTASLTGTPLVVNAVPAAATYPTLSFTLPGTAAITIALGAANFTNFTQYSATSDVKGVVTTGNASGSIDSFSISQTGEVVGTFTNGEREVLGTIGLADFDNATGLQKLGSNLFIDTPNSGAPKFGVPGSGSLGALAPGALEMSNVDLSQQFTEMITTQRGFQANSRVITTTDEMLQELVNLKR